VFGPGDPFGAVAALVRPSVSRFSRRARSDVCVMVPRGAFFALLEQHLSMVRGRLPG
jgi:hypothetical protein